MKYKIKKGLILEKKGNKINIFDPEKSVLFSLNETASLILKKIKKGLSEKEIISILEKKYNKSRITLQKDAREFLKKAKKLNIIFYK